MSTTFKRLLDNAANTALQVLRIRLAVVLKGGTLSPSAPLKDYPQAVKDIPTGLQQPIPGYFINVNGVITFKNLLNSLSLSVSDLYIVLSGQEEPAYNN